MNQEELKKIVEDAVGDADLGSRDIPIIDLYVDQIISLVSEKQKEATPRHRERLLTKTMINNYSKDGLITPVKGKKYNKEQIAQMLTVYLLKGTLTIGEIKRLLGGAYAMEGFDGDALIALYDRQVEIKSHYREQMADRMEEMFSENGLDPASEEDYLVALSGAIALSGFYRNIAQAMIDSRYPEPPQEEEDGEKSKKKDKDKEKDKKKSKKAAKAEESSPVA